MVHAFAVNFDVMENLKKFWELNKALVHDWTIFVKYKRMCYNIYFVKIFRTKQGLRYFWIQIFAPPSTNYLN
jgi:hypothetical protein